MVCVLIRRKETQRQTYRENGCDYEGKDWSVPSIRQGMPKIGGCHQELKESHATDFFLEPPESVWP